MSLPFYNWSRTAASNASADSTVNWAEGQSPSSVNDSARAMMASTAAFRDDISGAIATGGASTAYTVTSFQIFDTLAHLAGQMIAFVPHTTNGPTVTLNVDGLGAKPLRQAPSVDMLAGVLIQGTPYVATYNNSDAVFYLQNAFGNPYNVPLASGMDYWGSTTPNSAFAFPAGQAISRTTYATLFAVLSTTYGTGDGSTTFNLPDKTGRVSAMKEASASRLTSTYFTGDSTALGAVGGAQSQTLTTSHLPASGLAYSGTTSAPTGNNQAVGFGSAASATASTGPLGVFAQTAFGSISGAAYSGTTANMGSGNPHTIVQPTIIANYIIRII